MSAQHTAPELSDAFSRAAASKSTSVRRRAPPPFSLRLTAEERESLLAQAGARPLGAFIRARLLGKEVRPRRQRRQPTVDHEKLAAVLAGLGQSRLSQNLNQLAYAANCGTLDVSPDLTRALEAACADIRDMRNMLITALELKPGSRA